MSVQQRIVTQCLLKKRNVLILCTLFGSVLLTVYHHHVTYVYGYRTRNRHVYMSGALKASSNNVRKRENIFLRDVSERTVPVPIAIKTISVHNIEIHAHSQEKLLNIEYSNPNVTLNTRMTTIGFKSKHKAHVSLRGGQHSKLQDKAKQLFSVHSLANPIAKLEILVTKKSNKQNNSARSGTLERATLLPNFRKKDATTRRLVERNLTANASMIPTLKPLEKFTDTIVILTPVSNSVKHIEHYVNILNNLTYPHHLLSLVLGEDSSIDGTLKKAKQLLRVELKDFRRTGVYHFKSREFAILNNWDSKHAYSNQHRRRAHMAKSRNQLLFSGLKDEIWVLWVDSDISHAPRDLVQQLLAAKKDIVVPNCLFRRPSGRVDVYDRNTWQETKKSRKFLMNKPKDYLMLEGYGIPSERKYLLGLRENGPMVTVDGVGGCALLVRAELHRKGLVFPSFVLDHHIETEGLAKMAQLMGYKLYGMPFVEVFH